MSEGVAYGSIALGRGRGMTAAAADRDPVRVLQLGLATLWLLDAVLQFQSFMFTKAFGQMLAESASGNPSAVADSITWSSRIVEHYHTPANAAFAIIQLLIALGIAWRPTLKISLAASIAWSVSVWWFGEGLGGVLAGSADPLMGAPGAVILYSLLAVLLWPAERARAPFAAARPLGAPAAVVAWLVLWGSLCYFAVLPANSSPHALTDMMSDMADGEPGWISSIDHGLAGLLNGHGLLASIVMAVVFGIVAMRVVLPPAAARVTLVLALVAALAIWVAQDFGEIFTGSATDPNSAPLLALLTLAYWPMPQREPRSVLTAGQPAQAAEAGPAGPGR